MLKAETTDRVRLLTLDRPEVLNAFNDALFGALREALTDAADDDGVAVVVVTGEGRAFSAGADLTEMGDRTGDGGSRDASHFPPLIELLAEFPKPLLIAVNGIGVGIGATILGFADLLFGVRAEPPSFEQAASRLLTGLSGPRFLYYWEGGR